MEKVYANDHNFLKSLSKREIKIERENLNDAQSVNFEIELLKFSNKEIEKILEIYANNKKAKQASEQKEEESEPLTKVFKHLHEMVHVLEQIISKFLKYIHIVECYAFYFQNKYLLKNNLHPLATYLKLTFINRFFKNPIFRFLLVVLLFLKMKEFNIFNNKKYHENLKNFTKQFILKYTMNFYESTIHKILEYLKLKNKSNGFPIEKASILQKQKSQLIQMSNFYVIHQQGQIESLKNTGKREKRIYRMSDIFNENLLFERIETKFFSIFSQNLNNKSLRWSIGNIHEIFCLEYNLKFKKPSLDFQKSDFSKEFGVFFLKILGQQEIVSFLQQKTDLGIKNLA